MVQRHDISWIKAYAIAIASLLSGAAVVHNIFKPDLVGFCSLPGHNTKASYRQQKEYLPPPQTLTCAVWALQTLPISEEHDDTSAERDSTSPAPREGL